MSNRTVVILTEPEQCERADPNMLVQAVLQLQQLNAAGLAASQAFCDHPAAAMKFIEAYTKAYPELQQRSSDLPPPDALYSIVTEGGVRPLQVPAAPDGARPAEVGQLYPLYVLSLGPPDALIRALKHNSFAQRDIQVVDIAPAQAASTGTVSVAEAVADDSLAGPSWRSQDRSESEHDKDSALLADWSAAGDPLKLSGVEVDLDQIQVETKHDRADHRAADEVLGGPVVLPLVSTGAPVEPSGLAAASGANGGTAAEAATQAPPSSAVAESGAASAKPAVEAAPENKELEPVAVAPSSSEKAAGEVEARDESPASPAETDPGAGKKAEDSDADNDPAANAGDCDDGGDVLYPPTGSFATAADVSYPFPAGLSLSGTIFDEIFGDSGSCDAVDLEALARLTAAEAPAPDPALELLRDFGSRREDGAADRTPRADDGGACAIGPEADDDPSSNGRLPVNHDLDI